MDLLASNADGSRSIAVQVKASCTAWEGRTKQKEKSHWTFMMSTSDIQKRDSALIYVFVSLRDRLIDAADYFIMPGDIVSKRLEEEFHLHPRKSEIRMLNIFEHEKTSFHDRWDIIEKALA